MALFVLMIIWVDIHARVLRDILVLIVNMVWSIFFSKIYLFEEVLLFLVSHKKPFHAYWAHHVFMALAITISLAGIIVCVLMAIWVQIVI